MKQIKIALIMMILTGLCSCRKDLLNQSNPNLLSEEQVMSNTEAVTAYLATLYTDMPMEDFSFVKGQFWTFPDDGSKYTCNWSDEASQALNTDDRIDKDNLIALYKAVRNVNTFLKLIDTKAPNIDPASKLAFIAEAKFIRAYYYFGLVKYWGGVPLTLTPQEDVPTPLPSAKEVEVWDQVKKDLEEAAAGLPTDKNKLGYGRANKWVALALEARAMLHAASIGYFGDPAVIALTNGLNGVDKAHADVYMNAAYTASKAIIDSKQYALYTKYAAPGLATAATEADYAKNFQYLFYDTKQGDSNTEAIFNRGYDFATSGNRTHSQDLLALPYAIRSAAQYGSTQQASLDQVEKWQYLDGEDGSFGKYAIGSPPKNQPPQTVQYHFPTIQAPFEHKDPRYHGTIISNGTQFRNSPAAGITSQRGVIYKGVIYPSSDYNQFFNLTTKNFSLTPPAGTLGVDYVVGSGNSNRDNRVFFLKKWTDPVTDISLIKDYSSRTSWLDLRYGEILMIYAESSFELGKSPSEALGAVNELRRRAGIFELTTISRDLIRHERMVEFPFENKIWWDYVRWRSFATDFNNRNQYDLQCYWDVDTKDWVYMKVNAAQNRNFDKRGYYTDFNSTDISANPLLRPSGHNPYY